ncbi:hypothetical protein BJ684DRAFT_21869 [Piptocephalis cylindrospora]|uniref:POLO box domain-containing protein n=1 Tax=Piptocephalis cylindrospora TaxID=1907219 RepID=A0A4P9XYU8_9FUNG|nr:hypothetical protein BJ684DRAFT_21869 [Piptocephalis cylindrospora]|eukprot:RKP11554.1 hypothetical protein BJ684DRAFT_21869 [Piptocephalis cylindrospora]
MPVSALHTDPGFPLYDPSESGGKGSGETKDKGRLETELEPRRAPEILKKIIVSTEINNESGATPPRIPMTLSERDSRIIQGRVPPSDYGAQTLAGPDSLEVFESTAVMLESAFTRIREGRALGHTFSPTKRPVEAPAVFVAKWMDLSKKYGLGFELTDGSAGGLFKDGTILARSADLRHLEYLKSSRENGSNLLKRSTHTTDHCPGELGKKMAILAYFTRFMGDNLLLDRSIAFSDVNRTEKMDFISSFFRVRDAAVFRLSNRVLQFNFHLHYKLILSDQGRVVTLVDEEKYMRTWSLSAALREGSDTLVYRAVRQTRDILVAMTASYRAHLAQEAQRAWQ